MVLALSLPTKIHVQDSRFLSIKTSQGVLETLGTRHAGAESNKCDGIDSVFEIDEAAEVSGNIADDGSARSDHED